MSDEELTFEQARDELEETVRRLESGQTSLDEALRLWERGEALYELCQARLDQAEERIAAALERLRQRRPPGDRLTRSSQARTSRSERRRITSLSR